MDYAIDINTNYQAYIDFELLAKDHPEIKLIIIKLGEGDWYLEKRALEFAERAKAAGFEVVFYWFDRVTPVYWPEDDRIVAPQAKVNLMLSAWPGTKAPPAWDIEDAISAYMGRVTWRQIAENNLECLELLEIGTGKKPLPYTAWWIIQNFPRDLWPEFLKYEDVWWASYPSPDTNDKTWEPRTIHPWDKYLIHQFTTKFETRSIEKMWYNRFDKKFHRYDPPRTINVDLNKIPVGNLDKLLGITPPEPPPQATEFYFMAIKSVPGGQIHNVVINTHPLKYIEETGAIIINALKITKEEYDIYREIINQ